MTISNSWIFSVISKEIVLVLPLLIDMRKVFAKFIEYFVVDFQFIQGGITNILGLSRI